MANKTLFGSVLGRLIPPALRRNEAGGRAYARTPKDALAQYAATGCLNATFYASAETQLDAVLTLARRRAARSSSRRRPSTRASRAS